MPEGVFEVSVVTPESELLHAQARGVVLRSSEGDLTVLDGHTPIITDVVPGAVRVDLAEGDAVHLAVHGGYLHVETGPGVGEGEGRATRVTLLAGTAELADEIDVARAERAKEEAQARIEELRAAGGRAGGSGSGAAAGAGTPEGEGREGPSRADAELAQAEAALERARVRLEVAGARAAR